jgi:hypothetical protein
MFYRALLWVGRVGIFSTIDPARMLHIVQYISWKVLSLSQTHESKLGSISNESYCCRNAVVL